MWANSISKYLGASGNMEHDNNARQLGLQEQQFKLEVRKMALREEQLKMEQKKMEQQQYHERGYGYGIAYDRQGDDHQKDLFQLSYKCLWSSSLRMSGHIYD
jgi:hypothetical protein